MSQIKILLTLIAILVSTLSNGQNPLNVLPIDHQEMQTQQLTTYELHSTQSHGVDVNTKRNLLQSTLEWDVLAAQSFLLLETRFENLIAYTSAINSTEAKTDNQLLALAYYHFDQKDYRTSLQFFEQIRQVNDEEILMKHGYALFANKQFEFANEKFDQITKNTQYYYPSLYYGGMSDYYLGNYDAAISKLSAVDQVEPYNLYTPNYITQIYYAQDSYDQVIEYASQHLSTNDYNMHYLMGQSYYQLDRDQEALKYLTIYEENTTLLTKEEFFQLGKLHQKVGSQDKALQYFGEIATLQDDIAYHAQYLMAGIHIRQQEPTKAIPLLRTVGQSPLDVKDNANLVAAQLSANEGDNQATLKYCELIPEQSRYNNQAQILLAKTLQNTDDIEGSLRYLEGRSQMSEVLNATYNQLILKKVSTLGVNEEYQSILNTIDRLQPTAITQQQQQSIYYWKGKSNFVLGNNEAAQSNLSKVTQLTQEEQNSDTAYMLAYLLGKQEQYGLANEYLNQAINSATPTMSPEYKEHLYLLSGDYAVQGKDISQAKSMYEKAAKSGSDYAIMQLANIAKSDNDVYTRIYLLESLVENHPQSKYVQQSYFELGESHLQLKKIEKAITLYEKAANTTVSPTELTYESQLRLGLSYYNLGMLAKAETAYELVAESSPSGGQKLVALNALKEIYLNDKGDADSYFEFVENNTDVKLGGVEKDSIAFSIGHNSYITGDYGRSVTAHQDYLRKYPSGVYAKDATIELADALLYSNQYAEALPYYETLIQSNPSTSIKKDALKKAAVISLNHIQDYDKGYTYYSQLLQLPGLGPEEKQSAVDGAFFSALKSGNGQEGTLADYIIDDPTRSKTDKAKAYYHKGKYLMNTGKEDAAIKALTEVTRINKSNIAAESNYLIAEIFYKKGNLEAAERQAIESTKRSREYPVWIAKSLLLLSDIYIDKEDPLNAQAAAEAVKENYAENAEITAEAEAKLLLIQSIMDSKSRILPSQSDSIQFRDITPIENN